MASDKHGIKDKIAGKLKETEGKVKDEVNDLKESIKGNKKEG